MLVVLWFNCNFDVVMGRCDYHIYLLCHLELQSQLILFLKKLIFGERKEERKNINVGEKYGSTASHICPYRGSNMHYVPDWELNPRLSNKLSHTG